VERCDGRRRGHTIKWRLSRLSGSQGHHHCQTGTLPDHETIFLSPSGDWEDKDLLRVHYCAVFLCAFNTYKRLEVILFLAYRV